MPLPQERTVTGTFVNPVTGEPYNGTDGSNYVVFEPLPNRWIDQDGNQILVGGGRVGLDSDGHFSEALVCTDADGVLPAEGKIWRMRQFIDGFWNDPQYFGLTYGDGSSVDISDLFSVEINDIQYVPVPGTQGPAGPTGPAGPDGPQGIQGIQGPRGEDGALTTGISFGGGISVNSGNPLAIDIDPLIGAIADYSVDPTGFTEIVTTVTTTVVLDAPAQARAVTWFLMDDTEAITQQEDRPTAAQRRTHLVLGFAVQSGGTIFLAQSVPVVNQQPVNQLYDLMDAIGPFNISGNEIIPNGANLSLTQLSGIVFSRGWNYLDGSTPTDDPHTVTTTGAAPTTWMHLLRGTQALSSLGSTTIDVTHYDSAGTLTLIGGSTDSSVVHRLWMVPTSDGVERRFLQYGQQVYPNLSTAVADVGTADFVTNDMLPGNAILMGFLAVRRSATDLSDDTQAKIVLTEKFGFVPSSGSGSGSLDLYALLTGATFTGTVNSSLDDPTSVSFAAGVSGDAFDRYRTLADGSMEWGPGSGVRDAFLARIGAALLGLVDTDLSVGVEGGRSVRLRRSASDLDVAASASDLYLAVYSEAELGGTRRDYLRLEFGDQTAHAVGKWVFTSGPLAADVHTIDGAANQLGFHGATPAGQQTISGERSTGAALADLLASLDLVGLIADTSTAGPVMLQVNNDLSDVFDVPTARSNLGLGSSATRDIPPYVFDVTDYGAVGDGKIVVDAAMTSGSAVLTCATSAPFVPGDVSKNVMVLNAGASNETLVGTISSYTSATQVTLSVTAGSTVSAMPALYATDDTAAIQAAVNAAVAYALAHSYAATIYLPPPTGHFYGVAGALVTGGSTLGNSQITLPVVPSTGRKLTLSIKGAVTGAGVQHWEQIYPNANGSTLVSFGLFANGTAQVNSINAAGNAAVIGGPSQPGGYGVSPGVFSNIYVDIGDLSILTCHSKYGFTYSALDLSGCANARLHDFMYATSGTVAPPAGSYQSPGVFATGLAIGVLLPANGANDNTMLSNVTCGGGYTYSILVTEHTDIYALRILYCWAAFCPVGTYYSSVGAAHSIHGTLVSIETCVFLVYVFGPGTGGLGPTMYLNIDTETGTPRFGDRTSGTGLAALRGKVIMNGLFNADNLVLDAPMGLKLENGQLTFPIATKSANYTAKSFDRYIAANAAGGAFTVTLPTAVGRTDTITVKKIDSSGNAVAVVGGGSETIDGSTVSLAAQWNAVTVAPLAGNWIVVSVFP